MQVNEKKHSARNMQTQVGKELITAIRACKEITHCAVLNQI